MRTARLFMYIVTVVLLIVWVAGLISCKSEKKQVKIIVDLENGNGWQLMEGDSIWWQRPVFITDSVHETGEYDIRSGHSLPQDTLFGIKNLKPLVIIAGNDTSRYYLNNDTVRFSICKPDTVVKIVYRGIKNVEILNMY